MDEYDTSLILTTKDCKVCNQKHAVFNIVLYHDNDPISLAKFIANKQQLKEIIIALQDIESNMIEIVNLKEIKSIPKR